MPIPNWNKLVTQGRAVAVGVPIEENELRVRFDVGWAEKSSAPENVIVDEPKEETVPEGTGIEPTDESANEPSQPKEELNKNEIQKRLKEMGVKTKFGMTKDALSALYSEELAKR